MVVFATKQHAPVLKSIRTHRGLEVVVESPTVETQPIEQTTPKKKRNRNRSEKEKEQNKLWARKAKKQKAEGELSHWLTTKAFTPIIGKNGSSDTLSVFKSSIRQFGGDSKVAPYRLIEILLEWNKRLDDPWQICEKYENGKPVHLADSIWKKIAEATFTVHAECVMNIAIKTPEKIGIGLSRQKRFYLSLYSAELFSEIRHHGAAQIVSANTARNSSEGGSHQYYRAEMAANIDRLASFMRELTQNHYADTYEACDEVRKKRISERIDSQHQRDDKWKKDNVASVSKSLFPSASADVVKSAVSLVVSTATPDVVRCPQLVRPLAAAPPLFRIPEQAPPAFIKPLAGCSNATHPVVSNDTPTDASDLNGDGLRRCDSIIQNFSSDEYIRSTWHAPLVDFLTASVSITDHGRWNPFAVRFCPAKSVRLNDAFKDRYTNATKSTPESELETCCCLPMALIVKHTLTSARWLSDTEAVREAKASSEYADRILDYQRTLKELGRIQGEIDTAKAQGEMLLESRRASWNNYDPELDKNHIAIFDAHDKKLKQLQSFRKSKLAILREKALLLPDMLKNRMQAYTPNCFVHPVWGLAQRGPYLDYSWIRTLQGGQIYANGLVHVDIDYENYEKASSVIRVLHECKIFSMITRSAGGNGVCAIARYDRSHYGIELTGFTRALHTLWDIVEQLGFWSTTSPSGKKIGVDRSCSDANRRRFACADPNAIIDWKGENQLPNVGSQSESASKLVRDGFWTETLHPTSNLTAPSM